MNLKINTDMNYLSILPKEINIIIISKLNPLEFNNFEYAFPSIKRLLNDENVFRTLMLYRYPDIYHVKMYNDFTDVTISWKITYRSLLIVGDDKYLPNRDYIISLKYKSLVYKDFNAIYQYIKEFDYLGVSWKKFYIRLKEMSTELKEEPDKYLLYLDVSKYRDYNGIYYSEFVIAFYLEIIYYKLTGLPMELYKFIVLYNINFDMYNKELLSLSEKGISKLRDDIIKTQNYDESDQNDLIYELNIELEDIKWEDIIKIIKDIKENIKD